MHMPGTPGGRGRKTPPIYGVPGALAILDGRGNRRLVLPTLEPCQHTVERAVTINHLLHAQAPVGTQISLVLVKLSSVSHYFTCAASWLYRITLAGKKLK